jgi:hypothetical protein
LFALAAEFDKAATEYRRVLHDVLAPAEGCFSANRDDKAAMHFIKEARRLEAKTCAVSTRAAKKFSAVSATNLKEKLLSVVLRCD